MLSATGITNRAIDMKKKKNDVIQVAHVKIPTPLGKYFAKP